MSNDTKQDFPMHHHHPNGRRCCGRLLHEKCSPEHEAAQINQATGEKRCCKGHHHAHGQAGQSDKQGA